MGRAAVAEMLADMRRSLAAFNVIMAAIFAAVIWDGAQVLRLARNELRLTRESDRLLEDRGRLGRVLIVP